MHSFEFSPYVFDPGASTTSPNQQGVGQRAERAWSAFMKRIVNMRPIDGVKSVPLSQSDLVNPGHISVAL